MKHGVGTSYYADGSVKYVEELQSDKFHGNLTFYYTGEWQAGQKHGLGTLHYADGSVKYEGGFEFDNFHGGGTYYYPNGVKHHGEWKNGDKHGIGRETLLFGFNHHGMWSRNRLVLWYHLFDYNVIGGES